MPFALPPPCLVLQDSGGTATGLSWQSLSTEDGRYRVVWTCLCQAKMLRTTGMIWTDEEELLMVRGNH